MRVLVYLTIAEAEDALKDPHAGGLLSKDAHIARLALPLRAAFHNALVAMADDGTRRKDFPEGLTVELLDANEVPPQASPWIHISEKMPDKKEPILALEKNKNGKWGVLIAYWTVSQTWNPGYNSIACPTGWEWWMPLPRPPETEP